MARRIYTDTEKSEVSRLNDPSVDEQWADEYIKREAAKIRDGWDANEERRRRVTQPVEFLEIAIVSEGHYIINGRHGVRR